jgi:hypothetical protein
MDTLFSIIEAASDAKKRTTQPVARKSAPSRPVPAAVAPVPAPAPEAGFDELPHLDPLPGTILAIPAAHRAGGLRGLFEDGNSLVRAVIAAEVLGPPVALREQSHWSQPQSDRSTSVA